MSRFRLSRPAAPRGAGLLLAACCWLGVGFGVGFGCVAANAQSVSNGQSGQGTQGVPSTAAPYTNPFAPDLQADPKGKTPSWEKFNRPPARSAQSENDNGQPGTFKPDPDHQTAAAAAFGCGNDRLRRHQCTQEAR